MDRTERFYKIEMMIRTRGCVSMSAMLQEIEVSHATLKRDLLYLRDRMDAPIVYDYFDRGYRLQADQRDARQLNHQLPGVWFSEPEIHALLTMHQLVQGLDDGGVLARHLQQGGAGHWRARSSIRCKKLPAWPSVWRRAWQSCPPASASTVADWWTIYATTTAYTTSSLSPHV